MASKTRWDITMVGGSKQLAGVEFYRTQVGKEVRWLSQEGLVMLEKAKKAGVAFKTVRKAMKHFTEAGTRSRLKTLRGNIKRDLDDLLSGGLGGFTVNGSPVGLMTMLDHAGLKDLADDFAALLNQMDEAQLREFYSKNKLLLQKFFADSDVYTTPGVNNKTKYGENGKDAELAQTNMNVRRNALKLRDKMLQILLRDMDNNDIMRVEDAEVRALLVKYSREHLVV